jgi:endonuclease YncB( thermonuclease family)
MLTAALFACMVVAVSDGDTFRCADGARVRLAAIDSPELKTCRRGRVCAPGNAKAAKASLTRLALGKTVRCRKTGMSWGRVTAWCSFGRVDLSCAQFRAGHAIRLPQYDVKRELCRR